MPRAPANPFSQSPMSESNAHSTATAATSPGQRAALAAFAALVVIYFFSFFQRAAIPGTVFNEVQADFHLTAAAVTALGAIYTYVYGGMQLFVGFAADRFGGIRTLLVGGAVMTLGALLFPLAHSDTQLYFSRILTAAGGSCMYLSIVKEVDLLFPARHFAMLMGCALFVGYSGGVAGMLPFERVVAACGWRPALLGVGALMVLALALAWRILRRYTHFQPPAHPFTLGPLREILINRRNLPLLVNSIICFPIYFVIQTILGKKFLQDVAGLSSPAAATFTMLMMMTSATGVFAGGLAPRWLGHRRKPCLVWAGVVLLIATALLLWGVTHDAPGWVFLVSYLLLAASMFSTPAALATMKELNRPEAVALAIAVLNALSYIGAGILGNVAGLVLDRFRAQATVTAAGTVYPATAYATLFSILLGLAAVALAVTLMVPETRGRSLYEPAPAA